MGTGGQAPTGRWAGTQGGRGYRGGQSERTGLGGGSPGRQGAQGESVRAGVPRTWARPLIPLRGMRYGVQWAPEDDSPPWTGSGLHSLGTRKLFCRIDAIR